MRQIAAAQDGALGRGQLSAAGLTYPCNLAQLHWLRNLRAADLTTIDGVPTMSPLRAIWSEAGRYSHPALFERGVERIGRILDDAHVRRLVTWGELHDSLGRIGKRGRAGTTIMRALADQRKPGTSPTESRLEARFETVIAPTPCGDFHRQVVVGGTAVIGRTDFHHTELPVVAEVNSLAFHSTPSDQRADEARYALLVGAGFTVAVIWEDDLWSNIHSVRGAAAEAVRLAKAGTPGVVHTGSCPWPADPARTVIGRNWD